MVIPLGQCPVQGFRKYLFLILVPKVAWECCKDLIGTKNARTCSKCMKKWEKLEYCSTALLSQGQFHYGFSMVLLPGSFTYRCCLNFGTKSCLRTGQKNYNNTVSARICNSCMKNLTGDSSTMVTPQRQCSVMDLENCHILNLLLTDKIGLSVM